MTAQEASEVLAKEYVNSSDWENVQTYILAAWKADSEMEQMDIELANDLMPWTNDKTRKA